MRIFLLGATGWVGPQAARWLTGLPGISSVVVAARDLTRAQAVADEVGATAAAVEAEDEDRLTALLGDCDVLVNTSGPDERVLVPALRSAIRSGTHYCDIAADAASVERALEMHERAASAGVTAVVGIGAAPGFTNLLCQHAMAQLDAVEEIRFGYVWPCPQPSEAEQLAAEMRHTGRVSASWETLVRYVAGPVRVVREGRLVSVDPWAHPETIDLPEDGAFIGFPVGSAEPLTLLRQFPGLRHVVSVVSMFPPSVNQIWKECAMRVATGAATPAEAVIELHLALAGERNAWPNGPNFAARGLIGVNVIGRRAGERGVYRAQPTARWCTTAAMLTAACDWLCKEARQPGVFAPEAVFEPMSFFRSAAKIWAGELPGGRLLFESFAADRAR
jgi:hypothetical protein